MTTGEWKMKDGRWQDPATPAIARSVLECGHEATAQLPLLETARTSVTCESGRSLRSQPHSKTWRLWLLLFLSTLIFPLSTFGQPYSIDWYTIDGGGGTSTGGVYAVSGTIGQPDAGLTMTNGQYSVTGGFWALPQAVQTEGAPTLTIVPAGPWQAQISWTPPSTNWVLQETLLLSPASWTNSPSGPTNPILVPATVPTKFYRLFRP